MKLEDIKAAVEHATEAELKRSFYNACAVFPRNAIESVINGLFKEVYESNSKSASES